MAAWSPYATDTWAPNAFEGAPADATVIDLRDRFVLPGLIDSHVHLTSDKAGIEGQLEDVSKGVADHAYEAAVNARKTLAAGFTTVRNLGDSDGVTLALRDAIAAGKLPGPRILDAAMSISATAGHMDPTLGYREELHAALDTHHNTCNGADDCRRAVREQVARGADVIKFASTGGVNSRIGAGLASSCSTTKPAPSSRPPTCTARRSPRTRMATTASPWRCAPAWIRSNTAR